MPGRAFRPNRPAVASEVFDEEAVLIHFERGHYYSLDGMARVAWQRLVEGAATAQDLADRFAVAARGDHGAMMLAAERLLARLVELDLVVDAEPVESLDPPAPPTAGPAGDDRPPFSEPRVEVFTDLEELLLLDPIHEVAADGWPKAPAKR